MAMGERRTRGRSRRPPRLPDESDTPVVASLRQRLEHCEPKASSGDIMLVAWLLEPEKKSNDGVNRRNAHSPHPDLMKADALAEVAAYVARERFRACERGNTLRSMPCLYRRRYLLLPPRIARPRLSKLVTLGL